MSTAQPSTAEIDSFLFGSGLALANYFVERSPVSEVICYTSPEGRAFDLIIENEPLASAAKTRLIELGVQVRELPQTAGLEK